MNQNLILALIAIILCGCSTPQQPLEKAGTYIQRQQTPSAPTGPVTVTPIEQASSPQ